MRSRLFVSSRLFVISWETFMSRGCVKGGKKEYLRLYECGPKIMSGELKKS